MTVEAAGMMGQLTAVLGREIAQARALLRESVVTLGGAFDDLRAGSREQFALVASELFEESPRADRKLAAEAVEALAEQIRGGADRATECLQFEDVVGQLLDHCSGLIDIAQDLSDGLSALGDGADPSGSGARSHRALKIQLIGLRKGMESQLRSPVQQHPARTGEVDLF